MEKIEVILPLIVDRRYWVIRVFRWCGLLLLGVSFWWFLRGGALIPLILLFTGVLMLNVDYVIKEYNIIGSIGLLPTKIVVSDRNEIINYPIQDLSKVEIFLLEITGEFYGGKAITTKTGMSNFVKFQYQGEVKELMFLLDDQLIPGLAQVLQYWNQNNVVFKLHNQTRQVFI